jgi:hypothetical protein
MPISIEAAMKLQVEVEERLVINALLRRDFAQIKGNGTIDIEIRYALKALNVDALMV